MKILLISVFAAIPMMRQPAISETISKPFAVHGNHAFTYGERLDYRVHYGWLNAATISMKVDKTSHSVDGRPTYKISGDGETNSGYDWFFKVRDHYETYIDQDSMKPLKHVRNVNEGGYKDYEVASFDHVRSKVYSSKGLFNVSDGNFQDVLSAIYYLRNVDFSKAKTGDKLSIKFYLDKNIYESQVQFDGRETITTDLGKFRTIRLKPQLIVDRVFPDEDAMTIWATDDANLIPLRIQSNLAVGSLKADITKIHYYRNPLTSKVK